MLKALGFGKTTNKYLGECRDINKETDFHLEAAKLLEGEEKVAEILKAAECTSRTTEKLADMAVALYRENHFSVKLISKMMKYTEKEILEVLLQRDINLRNTDKRRYKIE